MSHLERFGTPGKLLALFLLLAGVPFIALTGLGWHLVEQDRALEEQRFRERLDSAASLVCVKLDQSLSGLEELLSRAAGSIPPTLPPDAACVVFDAQGKVRHQSGRLLFHPFLPSPEEPFPGPFAAAEIYEYRDENFARAGALYRELARREDIPLQAAALMRLARCLRRQQRIEDALAVYDKLAALGGIPVAGSPAELLAHRERIALLELASNNAAASNEATLLAAALWEGKYPIDRATFDFYRQSLAVPVPVPAPPTAMNQALAVAEAVQAAWERWQRAPDKPSGRIVFVDGGIPLAALWRTSPDACAILVAGLDPLVEPALATAANLRVSMKLVDPDGRVVWDRSGAETYAAVAKQPRDTGLPWVVRVSSSDPASELAVSARRRNLLIGGLVLVLVVIVSASFFVFRAVNRELSVARLQSDFVAAVSHEFRTPLTAMCHLTELLEEGNSPEDRLRLYYRTLGKESRRLRGMVESLLDFARMEAGRQDYHMEGVDIAGLVQKVSAEFMEQAALDGQRISLETPAGEYRTRADSEAMTRALWNLLDNAIKYSPASSIVRVSVKPEGEEIAIAVEDQGMGISKDEQSTLFHKFTRGTASRALNVKGTGIGLAMVDHIVKGHGGRVRLESELGRGSRFTILLPGVLDRQ